MPSSINQPDGWRSRRHRFDQPGSAATGQLALINISRWGANAEILLCRVNKRDFTGRHSSDREPSFSWEWKFIRPQNSSARKIRNRLESAGNRPRGAASVNFGRVAQPVLQRLSSETGLDTLIGVLDQERLLVVSRVSGEEFKEADVDTGTEFPAHATATGQMLLAHLPFEGQLPCVRAQTNLRLSWCRNVVRETIGTAIRSAVNASEKRH